MGQKRVVVISTLDTKGDLVQYLVDKIKGKGGEVITIDGGIRHKPYFEPEINREKVARMADTTIEEIKKIREEGKAIEKMAQGIGRILKDLFNSGELGVVIGLGGGTGTSLATTAMKALPFGIPKLMISTMAGGNVRPYVGTKDIIMFPTVADLVGLNRVTRSVLDKAASVGIALVNEKVELENKGKRVIGFSTIGGTEDCVRYCKKNLEQRDIEVIVYSTNGIGGLALEEALRGGLLSGIVEVSVRELVDHLFGGVCDAGPERFEWPGCIDAPKIIIPGSVDFIAFGSVRDLPERYKNRKYHVHHHAITLVRTDYHELDIIAKSLADKVNSSGRKTIIMFPEEGFSCHDKKGKHFYDLDKNHYFFDRLKRYLHKNIPLELVPKHINDIEFAEKVTEKIYELFDL